MKTIYHYGGWSRNYGDLAIQYSVQKNFNEHAYNKHRDSVFFVSMDLKRPHPINDLMINEINRYGDMLLIGGGGLLMEGDGFSTESGWQFNIAIETLRKLEKPLIIYAVGLNTFPYGNALSWQARDHLKYTYDKCEIFSVRDIATFHYMKDLVKDKSKLRLVSDVAITCAGDAIEIPGIVSGKDFVVGVNIAGDRTLDRFGSANAFSKFIENLAYGIDTFARFHDRPVKVLLIPHVARYDIKSFGLNEFVKNVKVLRLDECLNWLYPEEFSNVSLFSGAYRKCGIVLGMRGHSNILAFANAVPRIALGKQIKNQSFMNDIRGGIISNEKDDVFSCIKDALLYYDRKQDLKDWNEKVRILSKLMEEVFDVLYRQ
jgi:polysaccharide pyruvyl transferase WcaK-like protein